MKVNELFPSNYLKKEDVPSPTTVTIKAVTRDEINGDKGKELKAVLSFVGNLKPMVLNKGNATTIAEQYGDDTSTWPGKTIEVYTDRVVVFRSKRVGGLRVRIPSLAAMPAATASTGASRELWDISDGQKVIKNKRRTTCERSSRTARCERTDQDQAGRRCAGDGEDSGQYHGFTVAEGDAANDETPF